MSTLMKPPPPPSSGGNGGGGLFSGISDLIGGFMSPTGVPIPNINGGHAMSSSDAQNSGYFETRGGNIGYYAPFNNRTSGMTSEIGKLGVLALFAFGFWAWLNRKKRK